MGMDPEQFWKCTPAEFWIKAEEYDKSKRDRMNELLYVAWHTAVFSRMQKIPALKEVLIDVQNPVERKQVQTPEQMAAACKILTAALGGKIIEV